MNDVTVIATQKLDDKDKQVGIFFDRNRLTPQMLRPSKFEGHCPMIRHGCRMALMVALNWSVECVKEES